MGGTKFTLQQYSYAVYSDDHDEYYYYHLSRTFKPDNDQISMARTPHPELFDQHPSAV